MFTKILISLQQLVRKQKKRNDLSWEYPWNKLFTLEDSNGIPGTPDFVHTVSLPDISTNIYRRRSDPWNPRIII